jgi:hypothetical protein
MTEYCTIIGLFAESGETTVTVVPASGEDTDPHHMALRHLGALAEEEDYEVVAVLRGRCEALVTQQSLRVYAHRILPE